MKIKIAAGLLACMGLAFTAGAQEETAPKFNFAAHGRVLFDGAVFGPEHKAGFADGVAMPDIRLGGTATYGNWLARLDIGYGFGKLAAKDIYMQYTFNGHNLIRGGYFVHHFGLQSATGASYKDTFEAPITDAYMNCMGRNLGIMYMHYDNKFLGTVSGIAGTKITETANKSGKVSLGLMSRLVWHPVSTDGKIAHVGMSGWYQSAFHSGEVDKADGSLDVSPGYFNFSTNYPTKVDDVTLLSTQIDDARGALRLSPEFQLAYGRFGLAGQYYYMNVNRMHQQRHFAAQGGYGLFRALLLGDKQYVYSDKDGCIAQPKGKTLECVLSYNYTNASDKQAQIWGGVSNDWSVTFNYYINKYMLARLRWSYTTVRNSADVPDNHVNIVQARIQFLF